MHPSLLKLIRQEKNSRLVLGLMSGTSLDGLDVALCKIQGSGKSTQFELLEFESIAYDSDYLELVQPLFANKRAPLHDVTLANAKVARIHANMILDCLKKWGQETSNIDLIASHGQTIYHAPKSFQDTDCQMHSATLQIGDGDHLAKLTGIITISDFRQKHIASGGEGAPLVPYSDFLMFNHDTQNRMLLNIGGISNYTFIPANSTFDCIQFGDIGPGNTLMDQLIVYAKSTNDSFISMYGDARYDVDGDLASQGSVIPTLVKILTAQLARQTSSLNSTGQEVLNINFIKEAWHELSFYSEYRVRDSQHGSAIDNKIELPTSGQAFFDLMASLNKFTAETVSDLVRNAILRSKQDFEVHVYASGGGVHNDSLVENLRRGFAKLPGKVVLDDIDILGINADAKEAVMFALLANESIYGDFEDVFFSCENPLSGLGKISLP